MIKRILFILCLIMLIVSPVFAWTSLWTTTNHATDATNAQMNGRFLFGTNRQADFNNNITRFTFVSPATTYCNPTKGTSGTFTHIYTENSVTKGTADISWTCSAVGAYNSTFSLDVQFNNKTGTFGTGNYPITFATITDHIDVYFDNEDNHAENTVNSLQMLAGGGTTFYPYGTMTVYGGSAVPPSTNYSVNVHVNNLANQDLAGVYVEITNADSSYADAETTNSTGWAVFGSDVMILDDDNTLNIHIPAFDIYSAYTEHTHITANTDFHAVMTSASPSGTYRNITYYVKDIYDNPLSGIYLNHIVSSDFQLGDYTNASGYVRFLNVPVVLDTALYEVNENINPNWHDSSGIFAFTADMTKTVILSPTLIYITPTPTGYIPSITPTPTPVSQYGLYLTATPDSINLGSSVTLTGSSSYSTALTYAGGLRRTSFYVNKHAQEYPYDFNMIGQFENVNATYWKFRPDMNSAWQTASTTSPLSMVHTPDSNGIYTYSFNAYDNTSHTIGQTATEIVNVGGGAGSGSLTIKLGAYDATTNSQLLNFNLNLTDEADGTVTEYGNITFDKEITLPRGNGYVARATKTGYQTSTVIGETGTLLFVVPTNLNIQKGDFGAYFRIPLFPDGSVIAGNTSISAKVYDIETYYPLGNVQIVNSNAPTDIKYTGTDGESVSWVIPHNTPYTLTASKSGYCTITESKNTGTDSNQWVPLYMKYGACAGSTPTPTPTATVTATATPIGGWGNLTGGAIVCGNMPENATIIDVMKNGLACNGLRDEQSQNLGIAMLIILFAAIILGRIAKGVGVLAGVIAGTVLSTVAGFLPFWIIIVVIIIAGLVFAGKVFWSSGN